MVAVRIPGAESIDPVAPARDPGVTASPEDFGANIGVSAQHFGDAMSSLGAHLYGKLQKSTEDAWVQTHNVDSAAELTKAQYENRAAFPKGDADGGTAAYDDLKIRIAAANDRVTANTTRRMGNPTSGALERVNATVSGRLSDALVQSVTFGHNEQVKGKQTVLNDNVNLLGSRVLSGDMTLDDAMKSVDANAESGKALYSESQLVDAKDKWQRAVVNAAIENRNRAGDVPGGLAIRDKYFGPVPKSSGTAVDLPGGIGSKIDAAAFEVGLDPMLMRQMAKIESGGNPRAATGKYKGVFQLSDEGFAKHGGSGDIFDADQNIKAGARSIKADFDAFKDKYGRDPTATELYLSHQQGQGGLAAHLANPDAPAWQNMASTAEGRAKGDAWAKLAIWGNIPDAQKAQFGSVDNVTSKQFVDLWKGKVEGRSGGNVRVASAGGDEVSSKGGPEPLLPDPVAALHWELQGNARKADIKQAEARKQAEIEEVSAAEEFVVFKDMHSDKPTMSAQDILNNPKLKPDRAMALYEAKIAPKASKAENTYGAGFYDAYKKVHAPQGDPNRISDPSSLYSRVGPNGDLTVGGVDKLVAEIAGRKTPEGNAEAEMKSTFLEYAKKHISGEDLGLKLKDPKGEEQFLKFQAYFFPLYAKGRAEGKTAQELLDPNSPSYLGKVLTTPGNGFVRPQDVWLNDMLQDAPDKTTPPAVKAAAPFDIKTVNSLDDLVKAYKAGNVPKAVADRMAVERGWVVPKPAAAPVSLGVSQ